MPRILVTGMSGAGKSTLLAELERRGHLTVDTDYDDWELPGSVWDEHRMSALLAESVDVVVSGTAENQKLAVSIGVPPRRINEIVHGKRGITADTAIRLARYFGTSEEFWMILQSNYELRIERRALREKVAEITPLKVA